MANSRSAFSSDCERDEKESYFGDRTLVLSLQFVSEHTQTVDCRRLSPKHNRAETDWYAARAFCPGRFSRRKIAFRSDEYQCGARPAPVLIAERGQNFLQIASIGLQRRDQRKFEL